MNYVVQGHKEWDMAEQLKTAQHNNDSLLYKAKTVYRRDEMNLAIVESCFFEKG